MPTEEKLKHEEEGAAEGESPAEGESSALTTTDGHGSVSIADSESSSDGKSDTTESAKEQEEEDDEEDAGTPAQLGAQRFVFAAYFTVAVAVAFLLSKAISYGWSRLALWKPQVGEPDEMVAVAAAAVIGGAVAFYYYRDEKVRTLAEEVASELGKVTWPSRDEVVNSTFVVLVTTAIATAFFALMDRFWGFITNLVYGV